MLRYEDGMAFEGRLLSIIYWRSRRKPPIDEVSGVDKDIFHSLQLKVFPLFYTKRKTASKR